MSLYDGLGIDNTETKDAKPDIAGWSSSFKLLQSQLQAKKANMQKKQKPVATTMTPVVDLKRHSNAGEGELHFNQHTGRLERVLTQAIPGSPFIPAEPPQVSLLGVTDEYNPLYPNDYEEFFKKRRDQKQKEREEERKRELEEREKRRKERHREEEDKDKEFERSSRRREEMEEEEEIDRSRPTGVPQGAAIAPPTSLIEEDSVVVNEEDEDDDDSPPSPPPLSLGGPFEERRQLPGASMGLAGSVASKIMAKYGYKEGQGLGKKEQGMSTALQVEKTSKRGGKIIHEKDIPKLEPPRAEIPNTNILKNPSKVILLLNMVGPGEVDEELEQETAEECLKYGKVIKCLIFEIPGGPDDEAVRIFLEFERIESAIKAIVDLNGRYFGGRIVRAGFYNLDKFRRLDLADDMQ